MEPDDGASDFAADVDAAAAAGISLETFDHLTSEHFDPGQFAEFMALDAEMQRFVLRVLGGLAGPADYGWLDTRDDAKAVASWMLELPGIRPDPPE